MVRLADLDPELGRFLADYKCPDINTNAWQSGPPLAERRVALISSAGLRRRGDRPFLVGAEDYRVLPLDKRDEVVQDHIHEHDEVDRDIEHASIRYQEVQLLFDELSSLDPRCWMLYSMVCIPMRPTRSL